jgi:hypothetical protein
MRSVERLRYVQPSIHTVILLAFESSCNKSQESVAGLARLLLAVQQQDLGFAN